MKKTAVIVIGIIITISSILCIVYSQQMNNKVFNQEKWNTSIESRRAMVEDLTKHYLMGLSKSEVIELLGRTALDVDAENSLEYIVGMGYIEEIGLIIFFDEKGIYSNYKISLH